MERGRGLAFPWFDGGIDTGDRRLARSTNFCVADEPPASLIQLPSFLHRVSICFIASTDAIVVPAPMYHIFYVVESMCETLAIIFGPLSY